MGYSVALVFYMGQAQTKALRDSDDKAAKRKLRAIENLYAQSNLN